MGFATTLFVACVKEPDITPNDNTNNQQEQKQNPSGHDGNEEGGNEESETLSLSEYNLEFSDQEDTKMIEITTSSAWNVVNDYSWIVVSPKSGIGNSKIEITVLENKTEYSRYGSIEIKTNNHLGEVYIDQQRKRNYSDVEFGDRLYAHVIVKNVTINAITYSYYGNIIEDGLVEAGYCVGENENPTIDNNIFLNSYTEDVEGPYRCPFGGGICGDYSDTIRFVGLPSGKTYFFRSYIVTSAGEIIYGNQGQVTTLMDKTMFSYGIGAIKGYFSVSKDKKIAFSKGNLQYQASTNTWRFAEKQWDFIGMSYDDYNHSGKEFEGTVVGSDNAKISPTYSGWIDLFGWGTSGWNSGAACYQPWSISENAEDYYLGGDEKYSMTGRFRNADWGVYNAISNGGNMADIWRTITSEEWDYLGRKRTDAYKLSYFEVIVNNVEGCLLLPDNWCGLNLIKEDRKYSASEWNQMETLGAVFLPYTPTRSGIYANYSYYDNAYTWTSSCDGSYDAYCIYSYGSNKHNNRSNGLHVRLVQDLK